MILEPELVEKLLENKIRTIVTGHQPHGDCPLVMKS